MRTRGLRMREREMWRILPVELIMEILSYLPAKSLLSNCKFVCKSWRVIVKDPDFVKMHLNRGAINGGISSSNSNNNNNNSNNQSLICRSGTELYQLHPPFHFEHVPPPPPPNTSTSTSSSDDYLVKVTPTKLDFEAFDTFPLYSRLVGSCNGLLCIDCGGFVVLLNLCTRRYKLSPREPIDYLRDHYKAGPIGFGCCCDSTATVGEYKVVRIPSPAITHTSKPEVKVYSMSTNSWRRIKDITDDIHEITKDIHHELGVFLNGALHWMGYVTPDIVSFDMRSEEFRILPRPPYDDNLDFKVLMIMRGCLCMVRIKRCWDLKISVMKEYGVRESWTQEFVIRLSSFSGIRFSRLRSIKCLDDQILVQGTCGRLILYDMNKNMSVYIDIQVPILGPSSGCYGVDIVPCIESLVSLKSSVLPLSKDRKRRTGNSRYRNQIVKKT